MTIQIEDLEQVVFNNSSLRKHLKIRVIWNITNRLSRYHLIEPCYSISKFWTDYHLEKYVRKLKSKPFPTDIQRENTFCVYAVYEDRKLKWSTEPCDARHSFLCFHKSEYDNDISKLVDHLVVLWLWDWAVGVIFCLRGVEEGQDIFRATRALFLGNSSILQFVFRVLLFLLSFFSIFLHIF